MIEKIKISILIYVRNGLPYIERCIRSVMNQTLQEIEILVIDGGSTDGTLDIIKELSRLDTRIRLIHSVPGVGLQFNTGLREAKGEYIGICESDDYLLPGMYERQYELAKRFHLDILRADAIHFVEDRRGEEHGFHVKLSREDGLYDCVLDLTRDRRILELGVNSFWSGLYRRDFLLDEKLFMNETSGAAYQDTTFSFLTSIKAKRAMLSHEAFYCYRLDNTNSSVNNPKRTTMLIEEYRLLKKRLEEGRVFEKYKEIYFFWKVRGHLGFYDSLSEGLRKEYISLIYQDLVMDITMEKSLGKSLSGKEKEIVSRARQSEEALEEYLENTYRELELMYDKLEAIESETQIIIFGCGDLGKLVDCYLTLTGRKAVTYADNNSSLWETRIGQLPVMAPETVVKLFPEGVYIIANVEHFKEIQDQLSKYQVCEEKIILCNDYGFFFKHVLLKRTLISEGDHAGIL